MVDKVHFPDLVQLNDVYFCEYNLLPRGNSLINLNLIINNKKIADANRLKQLLNMPTVEVYALPVCYLLGVYKHDIACNKIKIKTNWQMRLNANKFLFPDSRLISIWIIHLQSTNDEFEYQKAPIDLAEEIHVSKNFTENQKSIGNIQILW